MHKHSWVQYFSTIFETSLYRQYSDIAPAPQTRPGFTGTLEYRGISDSWSEGEDPLAQSFSKGPKLEFPSFDCEDPVGGISRLKNVLNCKTGWNFLKFFFQEVKHWLRSQHACMQTQNLQWHWFCRICGMNAFKKKSHYWLLSHSNRFDRFEDLMALVKEKQPILLEDYFLVYFISDLKSTSRALWTD